RRQGPRDRPGDRRGRAPVLRPRRAARGDHPPPPGEWPMIPLTLKEIAEAVGGRVCNATGDEVVSGTVEFDSREVTKGGLFVALPGERVDGHDFAAAAIDVGAVAVLAAREVDAPSVLVPPVDQAPSRSVALLGDRDGSGAAVLAGLAGLATEVAGRL